MELEQRVKALEQEVEILKNEIQATLLDIREMLLTSAYPSLRAGDEAKQTEPKRPARAAQPVREQPEDETPDEAPVVRKVVLDNAGLQPETGATQGSATRPAKSARQAVQPAHPAEEENDELDQKPVVRRVSPNDAQTPTSAYQNSKARSTFDPEQANLEDWVSNKVEQVGVDRTWELIQLYAKKGHITPEIKDMLLQALAPYMEQTEQMQPKRPQPRVAPSSADEDEKPGDNTQRLVLKLIAGVQNAGVGLSPKEVRNG